MSQEKTLEFKNTGKIDQDQLEDSVRIIDGIAELLSCRDEELSTESCYAVSRMLREQTEILRP